MYFIDSVWQQYIPFNNFSGLASSVFLVFFYFCYDHGLHTNLIWYDLYFISLGLLIVGGDVLNLYFCLALSDHVHWIISIVWIFWAMLDLSFIFMVYRNRNIKPTIRFSYQVIVELITRSEIIFCVLLPIYASNHGYITSNNFAYILLFECFSHSYLLLSMIQKLQYWIYILFAIVSIFFEWFDIVQKSNNQESGGWIEEISYIFELIAGIFLYLLIYNQLNNKENNNINFNIGQNPEILGPMRNQEIDNNYITYEDKI
mmetsp:Transcript_12840/g.11644  ORF Transcript_12840/g.11644 Transcript_12840/m.11644 type:complete len:259 (+) Transcript_12840:349-1125(+)